MLNKKDIDTLVKANNILSGLGEYSKTIDYVFYELRKLGSVTEKYLDDALKANEHKIDIDEWKQNNPIYLGRIKLFITIIKASKMKTIQNYIDSNNLKDLGLNAEWSISMYRLDSNHVIYDTENGFFNLCYQPENYQKTDDDRNFVSDSLGDLANEDLKGLTDLLTTI